MSQKLVSALRLLPLNKVRCDIVNPSLCDDIVQRLKPSLTKYVGCTIIDINPGPGLFSRKIHEHLQPRSHVLLEPKQTHYQQFLQPLLDAPGSRFHIRDWPDEYCWDTKHFIHEGLMPDADGCGGPSPTTPIPNNLALIIGNMANSSLATNSRHKKINYASLKAIDFGRKARQCAGSPEVGPPRMLVWMSDSDKYTMVPRTVASRGRTSSILEAYCYVEEIAGAQARLKVRREDALDIRSMQRVATKMQGNSIQFPNRSRSKTSDTTIDLSSTSREWHQELQILEEGFKAQTLSQYIGLPPGPLTQNEKISRGLTRTPEYLRMLGLRSAWAGQSSDIKKIGDLLQRQAEIDRLDIEVATSESIDVNKKTSKLEELDARIAELKKLQGKLSVKQLQRFMFLDDDRRAFEMDPPLLLWDRRNAEPIIAEEDDFYNPKEMALLDFQTRPVVTMPSTTAFQDLYYDVLASALLASKSPNVAKQLDNVAPGAYQALVKNVPSLRDPRRGGRRDVESVRARMMTPEMICELAFAWDEWAFKPPLGDSLYQTDPTTMKLLRGGGPAARQYS